MTRNRWFIVVGFVLLGLVVIRMVWRESERAPKMCITAPC
jgi:cytochrome b561